MRGGKISDEKEEMRPAHGRIRVEKSERKFHVPLFRDRVSQSDVPAPFKDHWRADGGRYEDPDQYLHHPL